MSDNIYQSREFKANLDRYEAARTAGGSVYMEPDELMSIAEYYHLHGRLTDALDAIEMGMKMFPGATQPLAFRARIAILIEGDAKDAMHYAEMIEDKQDLDYLYIVAEIMIADNRVDEAEDFLESKESTIDEEDIDDYVLDVATLFADYDCMDLAQLWLGKSNDKDEPDYKELQGRIAMSEGNYEESERIFNTLIDENPYSVPYWNQLASSQYMHNKPEASIESSDFSLAINPDDADAVINKANGLTLLNNFDEAIKYYRRFQKLQPHSEIADMGIGSILTSQNRLQEALMHYQRAEQLCAPQSVNIFEIYRQLCLIHANLGQLTSAFSYADKLKEAVEAESSDLFILYGYLYMLQGDKRRAQEFQHKALELSEDDRARTKMLIAYSAYDSGYINMAHQLFVELIAEEEYEWKEASIFLALCNFDLGRREAFLSYLEKAATLCPQETKQMMAQLFPSYLDVNDYYHYACTHIEMGASPKEGIKD